MTSPHRDPKLEALLDRHGIDWEFEPNTSIGSIDLDVDTQIRDQTDPEVVERYAEALADGALFPAVLLRIPVPRTPPLQVAGGWHRVLAHVAAERQTIPAYWAEMTDAQALAISVEDNATHGLPLTNAERIRHAMALIDTHGLPTIQAAARVGLSNNMLTRAINRVHGQQRADRMHVGHQFRQLAESSQSRLVALTSDTVFAMVVNAASVGRWGANDIYELVTELNRTPDDMNAQMVALGDFEESKEHGASRSKNWAAEARSAALRVNGLDLAAVVKQCRGQDRQHTSDSVRRAGLTMLELAERLANA